jgi:hypothetical protein
MSSLSQSLIHDILRFTLKTVVNGPVWLVMHYHTIRTGVVLSVVVTGPKVCGFKPGQGNGFLMVIKNCSTPSFGGEV